MFCLASISNFRKNKDVVHQPKLVRMGKLCPLSRVLRRRAQYFPIQASRLVNNINLKVFGSFLISKTITFSFTDFLALTNTFSKNFNSLNRSLLALPSSSFCLHYIVFFTTVLLTAALRNLSNIKAKHFTLQESSLDQE